VAAEFKQKLNPTTVMAGHYMTPNALSTTSFINNSTNYPHFSPSYPISPLDGRFPQPLASTSRQPSSGQENTSEAVLNYPVMQSSMDRDRVSLRFIVKLPPLILTSPQLLHQAEAENSRLRQRLLVMETEKQNEANDEKYNAAGKKKRLPNIVRHLAHGFAFSKFLWIQEKASVICKSRVPSDFDPSTRYSLKPATPEASRTHALNVFLWELEQYLPVEFKHYLTNEKIMEKVSLHPRLRSALTIISSSWCKCKRVAQTFKTLFAVMLLYSCPNLNNFYLLMLETFSTHADERRTPD
jgi:hypothetical protein